nr:MULTISPECIES: M50 family metallopeptidase [unclassified Stenotrophomonas]
MSSMPLDPAAAGTTLETLQTEAASGAPALAGGVSWHVFGAPIDGRLRYVVKSAISGNYLMTSALGVDILASLDGNRDLDALCQHVSALHGKPVPAARLSQFLDTCLVNGMIQVDSWGDGKEIVADAGARRERLGIYSKVHNADALLDMILEYRRWWLNPVTKAAAAVLCLLGLANIFLIPPGGGLIAPLKQMDMSYTDVFLLALPMVFVIELALHELGHALACRLMGARPKGFGVGLLFGVLPIVFTETTDSYTIPSRTKRAFVSFAGPMVNLMSFGLVMSLYWSVAPGGLAAKLLLAYSALPLASFLVSMNPFYLRMDGYWILADWLERPNLRRDAMRYLKSMFTRGSARPAPVQRDRREKLTLSLYLLVAVGWTVTFISYVTVEGLRTMYSIMQSFFTQSVYF